VEVPGEHVIFPGVTVLLPDGSIKHGVGKVTANKFNTQCAEQCNRALERIRLQSSFMKQANFMDYTKYFLAMHNRRKISSSWKRDLDVLRRGKPADS
jgi:hypothetical protein